VKVGPSRAPVLILCSPQKPARISRTTDTEHQQSTIVKRPQASDYGLPSIWRHRPTSANHGLFRPPEAHAQAEFVGPSQQDPRPLYDHNITKTHPHYPTVPNAYSLIWQEFSPWSTLLNCVETNQRVGVRIPRGAEILEILRESPSSLGTSQVAPLSHRPIERRWIGNRLVLREWEHALRAAPHRRDSPLVHRERADASRLNGAEALDTSTGDLRRFVGYLLQQHRSPATTAVRSRSLQQC
jgi:hypothetical protein